MDSKEEYEEIGKTKNGEKVYRSNKNSCICTEKDYSYLVLATPQEIEEAGLMIIEESCRDMEIWILTDVEFNGKKLFRNSKDGQLAVRIGKNRLEKIEKLL